MPISKRNSRVLSDDGRGTKIEVLVKVRDGGNLVRRELNEIAKLAANKVADAIRTLPYTDFGPHNTRVEV